MHAVIPLYPDFTALDVVGPYTVLAFAPGWRVTLAAAEPGPVLDDRGSLALVATAALRDVPAPDVVVVPGGPGTRAALADTELIGWIRRAHDRARWTTSVCSGSYLLGAAGLLHGLRATTHWAILDGLAAFGAVPVAERVVTEGRVVTAAGVSAGIDMALTLLGTVAGADTAEAVQLAVEYDPRPPFAAGHPRTAPAAAIPAARALLGM